MTISTALTQLRKCLVVCLLILPPLSVCAQNLEFTKENYRKNKSLRQVKKLMKKGDMHYYMALGATNGLEMDYGFALEYYLDAYKVNPNSALLNYKIANCYLHTLEKFRALPYAETAYELNPSCAYDMEYVLGCAYQQKLKFSEATAHFESFRNSYSGRSPDTLKMANKRIEESTYGIEQIKKDEYVLVNMGDTVNTVYAEYVPIVKSDESMLIFTARRPPETDRKKHSTVSHFDAEYSEDIFVSELRGGGWTKPERLGPPINQPNRHNASISMSVDGQTIYLYHYNHRTKGDIHYSAVTLDEWSNPEPLQGEVNSKYNESHFAVSYDGKTAYLISDRPGSYGGKDIWRVERTGENEWGNVTNLGPKINTEYDEDGAFLHPDGKTLYFSSEGHTTMGGHDIFESTLGEDGSWSAPLNMGYPINTPGDDVYFVLTADGKKAYLSSAREDGFGQQDIYCIIPFEKKAIREVQMVLFKGIVIDKETRDRIPATVEIVDNTTAVKLFSSRVDPLQGFMVSLPGGKNYGIAVEAEGYVFHSENFNLVYKDEYAEVEKVIEMQKVKAGVQLVLNNIFFDFDKSELKEESRAELKRAIDLLNKYPEIKIEIEGHTDDYGTDQYNIELSGRRAASVKDFLVANGFDVKRIIKTTGYGESKPVAGNDTKEDRAKNRRVEFRLVK